MAFAIKATVEDGELETFSFTAQKTMYGGRAVAIGDTVFVFASEKSGGRGLVARGVVWSVEAVAPRPGVARQTPQVSLTAGQTGRALRPLGRGELKAFAGTDGPEGELHFKFYRQATDKVVGLSDAAAAFLDTFF